MSQLAKLSAVTVYCVVPAWSPALVASSAMARPGRCVNVPARPRPVEPQLGLLLVGDDVGGLLLRRRCWSCASAMACRLDRGRLLFEDVPSSRDVGPPPSQPLNMPCTRALDGAHVAGGAGRPGRPPGTADHTQPRRRRRPGGRPWPATRHAQAVGDDQVGGGRRPQDQHCGDDVGQAEHELGHVRPAAATARVARAHPAAASRCARPARRGRC
jgi:hypothetical protein